MFLVHVSIICFLLKAFLCISNNSTNHIQYLVKYGYLDESQNVYSRQLIAHALKKAQKFGGIEQTGQLDEATNQLFNDARCGSPDFHSQNKYAWGSRWNKKRITYGVTAMTNKLKLSNVLFNVKKALNTWGNYSRHIFSKAENAKNADIQIEFYSGEHGDRLPFHGKHNAFGKRDNVAHTTLPPNVASHFDDDREWTTQHVSDNKIDFYVVMLHQMGHAMGLKHSYIRGTVMYPFMRDRYTLNRDDIEGLMTLYPYERPPTPRPTTSRPTTSRPTTSRPTTSRPTSPPSPPRPKCPPLYCSECRVSRDKITTEPTYTKSLLF